jgi:hypothetical protein
MQQIIRKLGEESSRLSYFVVAKDIHLQSSTIRILSLLDASSHLKILLHFKLNHHHSHRSSIRHSSAKSWSGDEFKRLSLSSKILYKSWIEPSSLTPFSTFFFQKNWELKLIDFAHMIRQGITFSIAVLKESGTSSIVVTVLVDSHFDKS